MATAALNPTHQFPEFLPLGTNSVAQWAKDQDGSVVVFIHGFGGDAIATWNDMQVMLPQDPRAANSDLVYYGYVSLRSRAQVHADDLLDFLEDLFARRGGYERIVLVGHSLGGVVVRRAIIVAHREKRAWAAKVRPVLFAPAHRGASIQELVAQAVEVGFLPSLYALTKFAIPVLQDLHPTSALLTDMREEYEEAVVATPGPPLLALVVSGRRDNVVDPGDFLTGDQRESLKGKDHFGVCKPTSNFRDPIDQIMKALL